MVNENPNRTILLIEDDFGIAEMLETFFRTQGFNITTRDQGLVGVATAAELVPDLVILDIRLPDIDGFEVARRLRGNRSTSGIPILFLTERRDRSDLLKGLELGADDYVTKPFDIMELKLRVKNIINRYHPQSQTNQITGLPDSSVSQSCIEKTIHSNSNLIFVGLKHINQYRDQFGFVSASDVIKNMSALIRSQIRDSQIEQYFLGHIGEEKFILTLEDPDSALFYQRLEQKLILAVDLFYPANLAKSAIDPNKRITVTCKLFTPSDFGGKTAEVFIEELQSI